MPIEIQGKDTVLRQESGDFGACPKCGKKITTKCSLGTAICENECHLEFDEREEE